MRCKISAEKIAAEENSEPKYLAHAKPLDGFSVETRNLQFETPSGDWFWGSIAISILFTTLPIAILFMVVNEEMITKIKRRMKKFKNR